MHTRNLGAPLRFLSAFLASSLAGLVSGAHARLRRGPAPLRWPLAALCLALLVVCVLPGAQIRLGASQLQGLIGSYTYLPDFALADAPATLGLAQAGTGASTVTITPINGFTGTVTLSLSEPSGILATSSNWSDPTKVSYVFSDAAAGTQSSPTATPPNALAVPVAATKNVTLTLTAGGQVPPGAYTLTITGTSVSPALTHTTTLALTVTATPPVLTSIVVSPASASVATGGSQQFRAVGKDQNGVALSPQPTFTWTVTGVGSVSSGGLYSAGATAGSATVHAASGSVSGTAAVTVTAAAPVLTSITVTPTPASVVAGGSQQFTAVGKDQNGVALSTQPSFTWTVGGGGTISGGGLFTAGAAAGGPFTVTAASGGVSGTASVTVTVAPPVLTTIVVSPASASVVTGGAQQFTASGKDQNGAALSPQPTFTWTAGGGGTISGGGLFTAGASAGGPFTVTAASGGVSGTASVTVTAAPPVLTSITVTPTPASVVTGGAQQFTASGKDQFGAALSPQPSFTWAAGGGGTISSGGLFTAGTAAGGPFTVTATSGSVSGTAQVTVTAAAPPVLTTVVVSPASASVATGGTQQFTASGKDQNGVALSPQPSFTWTVTGVGGVSSGGLYSAGATAGSATVRAASGSVSGTASVTVTTAASSQRINCGSSSAYTDSAGGVWAADQYFSGGTAVSTATAVTNTADPALYQTQRAGTTFSYTVPVPNGTYTLSFLFAEISGSTTGQRVFNVTANGKALLTGLDIYAAAGGNRAFSRTFPVSVTNGQLALAFTSTAGQASVAAIQVAPLTLGTPAADSPEPGWAQDVIPSDQSDASGDGPSSSESVSLPSAVKENTPAPDLDVFNPVGPGVSFSRLYRSALATAGYGSPGLSPGWVHGYDLRVVTTTPGAWGPLKLIYPNGAQEPLTPTVTGSTATFAHSAGIPYLISGVPSGTIGVWQSVTLTFKDSTTFTFRINPNAPGNTGTYLLTQLADIANRVVTLNYDTTGRLTSAVNDDAPQTALLSLAYTGGYLSSLSDSYNRQINYGFGAASDGSVTGSVLKTVSQVGSALALWQYDYTGLNGQPLLNSVQIASPNGTGLSDPAGTLYDAAGHVVSLIDANGNYRTYQYGVGQVVVSVYDLLGNLSQQWAQKFDPNNHNVDTGYIDGNNHASNIQYGDGSNPYRPTSILGKNSGNNPILIQYDAYGSPLTVTDPRLVVTTNTPDPASPFSQLQSNQVGTKTPTKFLYYDGTTQASGVTQIKGLVKSVFNPTPGTSGANTWVETDYTYTAMGDVATVTKPAPNSGSGTVVYTYVYATDPGDAAHGVPAYSQPEKHGEPLAVTAPSPDGVAPGTVTHFRYDAHANLTTVISPLGNRTDYVYTGSDATKNADQLVQVIYPATGQGSGRAYTNINYRYPGGPVASTDIYDESGVRVRHADRTTDKEDTDTVHSGDIQQAAAVYDPRYRATQIINGANQVAQAYTYEKATGNVKTLTYPMGDGPQISQYDPDDNITGFTNGRGQLTTVTRTADNGRASDLNYPAGTLVRPHYDYDLYNRITLMTDGTGTVAYAYDDDDRVTSTKTTFVAPNGTSALPVETISYAYNTDGTKAAMTTPGTTFLYNGGRFTYTYDNAGRMTRVNTPWVATALAYTYDADDRIVQQHTSRADTYYAYNQRGFLTELENVSTFSAGSFPDQMVTTLDGRATPGGRPLLSDFSNIRYDAEGNRTQMTFFTPDIYYYPGDNSVHLYAYDMDGIVHYVYDNLSRLHQEYTSNSDGTATPPEDYQLTSNPLTFQYNTAYNYTYNYGPKGNVTSSNLISYNQDGTNQSIPVTYNDNDQISGGGFFHDADGNATTYRNKGIVYDVENRAVAYDNGSYVMAWNGDAQRAWKQVGTNRTYFLYDGANVVAELDGQGRMIRTYGYGACGLAQSYLYDYGAGFGRTFTYLYNPAGSVVGRIRSDVSNVICDDVSYYDTFGQLHSDFYAITGGAYPNNLKDAVGHGGQFGQYTDLETQGIAPGTYLSLSGPEMYDPNLGRHLVRSGGLNEYQAQALPYTVLSSMGKGFLNAAAGSVVGTLDLALTVAQLSPMTLSFGQPIYHIPDKFYTPFTVGDSQVERASAAFGEFGFYALDAYLGASGAVRGGFSAARQELSIARRVSNCFAAGTSVQMADGTTEAIEQIKVGDWVKSRNPETGVTEAKRVTETFSHVAPQVLTLTLSDPKTGLASERITCTPGHPFYVDGKGFVLAGDLGIGTSIVTRAGPCLSVSGRLLHQDAAGAALPERVYNFTVEGDHTYFVGTTGGGAWVHNASLKMVLGRKVFRDNSLFTADTPSYVSPKVSQAIRDRLTNGETNLDLMRTGNAPIGHDGLHVNLHHILGEEPGPMIELSGSTHSRLTKPLHSIVERGKSFRRQPGLEAAYDRYRNAYWKNRAQGF